MNHLSTRLKLDFTTSYYDVIIDLLHFFTNLFSDETIESINPDKRFKPRRISVGTFDWFFLFYINLVGSEAGLIALSCDIMLRTKDDDDDDDDVTLLEDNNKTVDARIESLRQRVCQRPNNARAMSQLACLVANHDEAVSLAKRAVEVAPHKPFGFAALSILLPDFQDRMKHLQRALELTEGQPQHILARLQLAVRLLVEPRHNASRGAVMGTASKNHPRKRALTSKEEATYAQITQILQQAWSREWQEFQMEHLVKQEHCLGLFFRKKLPRAFHQARAKQHFEKVREKLPLDHSLHRIAEFWLATLDDTNNSTPTAVQQCPKDYIIGLYSSFAPNFDKLLLGSLHYTTPTLLRRLVDQVKGTRTAKWARKALDLGCSTGLSGLAFQDCLMDDRHPLIGVDLSPEMLAQAKQRNCYQELLEGDCLDGLVTHNNEDVDLITACDVFCYIGNLQAIFIAAHESLATHGMFAFSTELLEDHHHQQQQQQHGATKDFILQECARFAHSQDYIQRLSLDSGFVMGGHQVCIIRKNQGKDVRGSLVVLRKHLSAEKR
jgi:predicted TPR repeat methyltransferase